MPDSMNIRLTYMPDYSDTFAIARYARRYFYSASKRHVWWLVPIVQLVVAAVVIIWDHPIKRMLAPVLHPLINEWSPIVIFVVISFGLWLAVCLWLAPRLSARWLGQRNAPKPITFQVLPDRLHWEDESSGHWIKWAAIEQIFVTPTAVCFLVTPMTYFVPKRAFSDAVALRDFVELALQHLTEAAKTASSADRSVAAILDRHA